MTLSQILGVVLLLPVGLVILSDLREKDERILIGIITGAWLVIGIALLTGDLKL